ncbi:unnamed protein product [Calypogeia fissa]
MAMVPCLSLPLNAPSCCCSPSSSGAAPVQSSGPAPRPLSFCSASSSWSRSRSSVQWTASSLDLDSLSTSSASPILHRRVSPSRSWDGRVVVSRKAGRGASGVVYAAAAPPTGTEELPAKLQEIVRLFQQVSDPRAKYEQLLYYAKRLKPLEKEFCTKENKVEGCVSQVWVRPTLNVEEGTVSFEADSDSLLTKGLAALLVEGLSGATVQEVLKVNPDFIQMLGLKQSLTPSRSNGFLNMLKLMQKKTLQMYMEAQAGKASGKGSENGTEVRASASQVSGMEIRADSGEGKNGANNSSSGAPEQRSMKSSIEKKLQEALAPTVLVVSDVSHQHAGHAGVHKGATETHFNVTVVSDKFTGTSLIKRHRLIYGLLEDELKNGVHALSLVTKTPSEPLS